MTEVTIGLPYTDQTDQLELAITSVLAQTYHHWELILWGDGPSPSALEVAHKFRDPRIRFYQSSERVGLAASLNRIAGVTRSPLLARMDADDVMHPERIGRQKTAFEGNQSLDVLGTHAYLIDEKTKLVGAFSEPALPANGKGFLTSNAFSHPTIMARTSWFLDNPYDEQLLRGQDKELWLRTWEMSTFSKLPDRLMYYRVSRHSSGHRLSRNEKYNRQILRMYAANDPTPFSRVRRFACSVAKQCLFYAASSQLIARLLFDRKWTKLSADEHLEASQQLQRISDSVRLSSK